MELTVAQAQMIGHKTRGFALDGNVDLTILSDRTVILKVHHVYNIIDVDGFTKVIGVDRVLSTHSLAEYR